MTQVKDMAVLQFVRTGPNSGERFRLAPKLSRTILLAQTRKGISSDFAEQILIKDLG